MAALASSFAGVRVTPSTAARTTRRNNTPTHAAAATDASVKTVSIGATFAALKKRNQCAFIPFICAGDPNLDATEKALHILDDAGADVIELGVPYSDPLADGPVIQVRRRTYTTPWNLTPRRIASSTAPPPWGVPRSLRVFPHFLQPSFPRSVALLVFYLPTSYI
jgi:hypothetical protein